MRYLIWHFPQFNKLTFQNAPYPLSFSKVLSKHLYSSHINLVFDICNTDLQDAHNDI